MMNQMSSSVGKMTRSNTGGMTTGVDMESGMGMLTGTPGVALGDDYGTSLGRGMGFGATADMATTNGPLSQAKAKAAMQNSMNAMPGMDHSQMSGMDDIAENANAVPNFPQDAYMEGPMMVMDKTVDKPENYGLSTGWSGYMMGMMTFVRVLPPDKYDEIISRMKQADRPNDPYASILSKA
jgi:hypothetical protein